MKQKSFLSILFLIFLFISCSSKEKIVLHSQKEEIPGLNYSYVIPEYSEYPEFSKLIEETLKKDFEKYKSFAQSELEWGNEDVFTYRTLFEDFSNKEYLNVFIKKYIYCGPSMEDEYFITFCWDKKQNKQVFIDDVTGMTELELMDYCRKYVKSHLEDVSKGAKAFVEDTIDRSLDEDIENYSHFVASKKQVIIHFATGDSVPKGYGPQTVEIIRKR